MSRGVIPVVAKSRPVRFLRHASRSMAAAVVGIVIFTVGFHLPIVLGQAHYPFDYDGFHYPLLFQNFKFVTSLALPYYNPFVYAGVPYYNNVQAAFWYPPHLVFSAIAWATGGPTLYQAQYLNIVHFAFGAYGMYRLLKGRGIGSRAALTGSLLFIVNGHVLAQAQHLGVIEIMSWCPWALLAIDRVAHRMSWSAGSALGAALAMPTLVGFLPMAATFYVIMVAAAVVSVCRHSAHPVRHVAILCWSATVCVGISAPVVCPLLSCLGQSIDLVPHGSMPIRILATLVSPAVFGQFGPLEKYSGVFDPTVDYLFMGNAVLGVAASSVICGPGRAQLLLAIAVACGAVMFGPDALVRSVHSVPVVGPLFRPLMFGFPMVLFATIAATVVLDRQDSMRVPWVFSLLAVAIGLFCSASLSWSDAIDVTLLLRMSIPACLCLLIAIVLPRQHRTWALCALLVAEPMSVNINRSAWAYPGPPNVHSPTTVYASGQELLKRMRPEHTTPHRIAVDQQVFGGPWNGYWPVWGLESINGFDPQVPKLYFSEVTRRLSTWQSDRLFNPGRLEDGLFETLNVKYLLVGRTLDSPSWRHVMAEGPFQLYEFTRFRERYELAALDGSTYDGAGTVSVLHRSVNRVSLRAEVASDGALLVIRERAYPEWRVTVNASDVAPRVIDKLIMGVEITRGSHDIVLTFVSRSLQVGLFASGVTLVACVLLAMYESRAFASQHAPCTSVACDSRDGGTSGTSDAS
jgi:hypothetical protein